MQSMLMATAWERNAIQPGGVSSGGGSVKVWRIDCKSKLGRGEAHMYLDRVGSRGTGSNSNLCWVRG